MIASKSTVREDFQTAKQNGVLEAAQYGAQQSGAPLHWLLALASRESRMGTKLTGGTSPSGLEHGVWQIHENYHGDFVARHDDRDDKAHAAYAGDLLVDGYNMFGTWDAAAANYNSGPEKIATILAQGGDLDKVTTGDYVADTSTRAEYFKQILEEKGIGDPSQTAIATATRAAGGRDSLYTGAAIIGALTLAGGYGIYRYKNS